MGEPPERRAKEKKEGRKKRERRKKGTEETALRCNERHDASPPQCIYCGRVACSAGSCTHGYEGIAGIVCAELAAPAAPPAPAPIHIHVPQVAAPEVHVGQAAAPVVNVAPAAVHVEQAAAPVVNVAQPGPALAAKLEDAAWWEPSELPEVQIEALRRRRGQQAPRPLLRDRLRRLGEGEDRAPLPACRSSPRPTSERHPRRQLPRCHLLGAAGQLPRSAPACGRPSRGGRALPTAPFGQRPSRSSRPNGTIRSRSAGRRASPVRHWQEECQRCSRRVRPADRRQSRRQSPHGARRALLRSTRAQK